MDGHERADAALRDELLRLERALAERDPEGIEGGLMALIDDDFLEFGQSGRAYDAASVRAIVEVARGPAVPIEDFAIDRLAPDVVLATYRIAGARATRRSSLWVRRDGRWRMRFHQGTPLPPEG